MTIYDIIEPNIKYIVLSINFEHPKYATSIKLNTSLNNQNGFSCCWKIAKDRKIQKVVVYIKNTKEIYMADYIKRKQENIKYKIYFKNTKLIGKTALDWKDFVNNGVPLQSAIRYIEIENNIIYPDEIEDKNLFEGAKKEIIVNVYERNSQARQECVNHYGYKCQICNFDFEKVYGEIGKKFIHVHHIVDISTIGENYKVDPINDLIPVCSNCHAMLHKKRPAYSIEEMKILLAKKTYNKTERL